VTFESHYTAAGSTRPALRTIFKGIWPWMLKTDASPSLFRSFKDEGFSTLALIPTLYIVEGTNDWLRDGVDDFSALVPGAVKAYPPADQMTDRLLEKLVAFRGQRFFAWAHYFDPHRPYDAEGRNEREQYVGEVARVDREVGRLLDALEKQGMLDRMLVLLTSDHGEEFGEHAGLHHGFFLYEESVRVPLIVRAPGGKVRGRVKAPTSSFDLGPTLLALAGIEPLGGHAFGMSLFDARPNRAVFTSASLGAGATTAKGTFGVVKNRQKLMIDPRYGSAELYDLTNDPAETTNRIDERPEVAAALARLLRAELVKSGVKAK
jgi:arylsulfatase A-like enzyme